MDKTLYEKIGEKDLQNVLNGFYDRVFTHPTLIPLFENSDRAEVQEKQFLFLSQFLGGPQAYSERFGPPRMRARHLPHKITPTAAKAWLGCMKESIEEQDWEERMKEVFYSIFPPIAAHMINSEDEN